MRCPKCGAESQGEPSFCSTCGFELQASADEQSEPEIAPHELKGLRRAAKHLAPPSRLHSHMRPAMVYIRLRRAAPFRRVCA